MKDVAKYWMDKFLSDDGEDVFQTTRKSQLPKKDDKRLPKKDDKRPVKKK